MIAFFMIRATNNDGVEAVLRLRGVDINDVSDEVYLSTYESLSYHLPFFYFSIKPDHYPSNINKHFGSERELITGLLKQGVSYEHTLEIVESYENELVLTRLQSDITREMQLIKAANG